MTEAGAIHMFFADKKILLVDDFPEAKAKLLYSLEPLKLADIFEASHGEEALAILHRNPDIDLVISDWSMPIMTGLELWQEIRNQPHLAHINFCLLLSQRAASLKQQLAACPRSYVLLMPFSDSDICAFVNKVLSDSTADRKPPFLRKG